MMDIGHLIYPEIEKLAILAMPRDQQSAQFIPMIRLSDLKDWLDTLKVRLAPAADLSRMIDINVVYGELDE